MQLIPIHTVDAESTHKSPRMSVVADGFGVNHIGIPVITDYLFGHIGQNGQRINWKTPGLTRWVMR